MKELTYCETRIKVVRSTRMDYKQPYSRELPLHTTLDHTYSVINVMPM